MTLLEFNVWVSVGSRCVLSAYPNKPVQICIVRNNNKSHFYDFPEVVNTTEETLIVNKHCSCLNVLTVIN